MKGDGHVSPYLDICKASQNSKIQFLLPWYSRLSTVGDPTITRSSMKQNFKYTVRLKSNEGKHLGWKKQNQTKTTNLLI